MADSTGAHDQVARDDAHLRSLGIKPELQRSLGFLSNFAVAFSYISVSTGTFTNQAVAFGVGGPAIFWAWPLVILGQTFVALNFAELSSHFPVAGSIYQWSKRLSHKTLGWFTGWIYFWAGVITVTAVAVTVPLVLANIPQTAFGLGDPSPIPGLDMQSFVGLVTLLVTTIINVVGVRLLAAINNIGVAAEIIGMLVFALILLFFANHQSPAVLLDTSYTENLGDGYLPVFLVGMFMALFVVYGFDTAGTFGEETVDASRHAPRGVLSALWLSGLVGAIFLLAVTLSFQSIPDAVATGQKFGFPIADTIKQNLTFAIAGLTLGDIYLIVILIAVFVCTLAIQGATVRLMFSMGRDGRLPFGGTWGHVNPRFRTPANASVGVGVLAAIPLVLTGAGSAAILAIAATGTIYLSYFLCNLGVLVARRRGWPQRTAFFSLGNWGTVINVLALVWGGFMIVNIGLWTSDAFGRFGTDLRNTWSNPFINGFLKLGGNVLSGLPAIPVFEFFVGVVVIAGAIYYLAAQRGREDVVAPDIATGETAIA
ncbi:MAG: amino acid permease [Chloroflexota bacterium]